jgi:hypothetical protein
VWNARAGDNVVRVAPAHRRAALNLGWAHLRKARL